MDIELIEALEANDIEAIGEYLECYGKNFYNRKMKCYLVADRRFYPIVKNGFVVDWEEDWFNVNGNNAWVF